MTIISKYIERINSLDFTLKSIYLFKRCFTDSELSGLIDCLLTCPDGVTHIHLDGNRLTDESGFKLARYVAISSTIEVLDLSNNQLGMATHLAIAASLRINTSLRYLGLPRNQATDENLVDAAFINAIRLNPHISIYLLFALYTYYSGGKSVQLKQIAKTTEAPSMLEFLLYVYLDMKK